MVFDFIQGRILTILFKIYTRLRRSRTFARNRSWMVSPRNRPRFVYIHFRPCDQSLDETSFDLPG